MRNGGVQLVTAEGRGEGKIGGKREHRRGKEEEEEVEICRDTKIPQSPNTFS